ncbi:MAG: hypothetical protein ACKO04_07605, partial [Actinomycetes bacterium]
LLDLRGGPDEASFERAVSCAASVVHMVARRDELVRLVTTDGADSGLVPAAEQLDELMDRLAVVAVDPPRRDRPRPLLGTLAQLDRSGAGRVVTCTAGLSADDVGGLAASTRSMGLHVVVTTAPGAPRTDATATLQVRAPADVDLAAAWDEGIATTRPQEPAR